MSLKFFEFKWGWCKTCNGPFVRCPKCGNNCCNAGFGEVNGEICDVCNLAHQYQQLAIDTNTEPKTPDTVDEKYIIDEEIKIEELLKGEK